MEKRFAVPILIGLAFGAPLGAALGEANGIPLLGLGLGALAGVFIGWFAAAYQMQKEH